MSGGGTALPSHDSRRPTTRECSLKSGAGGHTADDALEAAAAQLSFAIERERERLGDELLKGCEHTTRLISEVWGGFSPEAMRLLGELAQARNDGVDLERANATWSTSSFTSYHGQLLSLAVQWGVAIEIERAIKKSARFC